MNRTKLKRAGLLASALILAALLLTRAPAGIAYGDEPDYLGQLNELCGASFESGQYLTREDFCVVIAKVFVGESNETTLPFSDADQIKPENLSFLAALYQNGILAGNAEADGLYMFPNATVTRQEAITFLGRILDKTATSTLAFSDAGSVASYAYPYIAWFADNQIIIGYPDGTLGPQNTMTAYELSVLTIKTLNYYRVTSIGTGMRGAINAEAIASRFTMPQSLLFDPNNNLIVVDTYNNMLRIIGADGVNTYIGKKIQLDDNNYQKGYYLDTVLADSLLNRPTDAVFSSKGELFVADSANNVIRFVREGRMWTFAGTTEGYLDGGPKVAQFNKPMAIAIDASDNLYVADSLNNCVRKIDTQGNVTTIAGNTGKAGFLDGEAAAALFRDPAGIAVSADGRIIYVADTGNHRIRKIQNGAVSTIAGITGTADSDGYPEGGFRNGPGSQAMFNQPYGIVLTEGIILVADSGNHMIRAISPNGAVTTVCGNGEPGDEVDSPVGASLNHPMGVCVGDGLLYVADTLNNMVKIFPFNPEDYK